MSRPVVSLQKLPQDSVGEEVAKTGAIQNHPLCHLTCRTLHDSYFHHKHTRPADRRQRRQRRLGGVGYNFSTTAEAQKDNNK